VSALEPLNQSRPRPRFEEDEQGDDQDQPMARMRPRPVFLPGVTMDDAHRAALAGDLARARERLGELNQAASLYGIAGQYDTAGNNAARWKQEADRVNAEISRVNANAQRRPEIKVALEQSRVVRPQIRRQP